jgi:lipopolysaccharide export system protein LptA
MPFMVNAKESSDVKNKINKKEPIEITSDKMVAYNEKKMVVFSGNAVVKQGDVELKCDNLILYYKKEAGKKEKVVSKEVEGTGDLDKIEAKGNVNVTKKKWNATSEEAVYYQDSGQIIMTGNPILHEDKSVIKGCKVTIYMNEDRGVVEACNPEKERVKATIYPQEKNEPKK